MRRRNFLRGPYGMGAMCAVFFIGLLLALFWPWFAVVLLCLAVAAAVLLLVRPRC